MTIAGGLGGAVGIAKETTYGTFVSPTRWIEVHSAKLQERPHWVEGTGLASGRVVNPGARRRLAWSDAGGSIEMEWLDTGMALLLANIMGSSASAPTQIGTTSAYQLACNLGVPDNQNYLSIQALVPNTSGVIVPENFHGCKITKAQWTADTQNPLMLALDIDAQSKEESTGAGSPSYTTSARNFTLNGMTMAAGAFGSESTVDGIRKMTVTLERALKTDRMYLGQTAKLEPVTNGLVKISGSAEVDLTTANKPILWDLFHSQAAVPSVKMTFVGTAIGSSGSNNQLSLNATDVFIDSGGTPELDGPDITAATLSWTGYIDSANDSALVASLISADTTF